VPTNNFTVDPGPCADGGSVFLPGAPVKDAGFLSCSQYDRNDPDWRHPPECSWFESPETPTDEQSGDQLELSAAPVGPGGPTTPLSGPGAGVDAGTATGIAASLAGVALLLLALGRVRRGVLTPLPRS
jgi:hypothetical protein